MANFVFQLQSLLRARLAHERRLMGELGQAQRAAQALRERLQAANDAIEDQRAAQRESLLGGVDVRSIGMQTASIARLRVGAQHLAVQLSGALARVEAARARLLEATTARRAVELLREARLAEHVREERRREGLMLDDVSQSRSRAGMDEEERVA